MLWLNFIVFVFEESEIDFSRSIFCVCRSANLFIHINSILQLYFPYVTSNSFIKFILHDPIAKGGLEWNYALRRGPELRQLCIIQGGLIATKLLCKLLLFKWLLVCAGRIRDDLVNLAQTRLSQVADILEDFSLRDVWWVDFAIDFRRVIRMLVSSKKSGLLDARPGLLQVDKRLDLSCMGVCRHRHVQFA